MFRWIDDKIVFDYSSKTRLQNFRCLRTISVMVNTQTNEHRSTYIYVHSTHAKRCTHTSTHAPHTHILARAHACIHACAHAHTHAYTHTPCTHMHTSIRTCTRMHTYITPCAHMHTCTRTCTRMHTHIRHAHTCIHTYALHTHACMHACTHDARIHAPPPSP
jgi:hypothetical protein